MKRIALISSVIVIMLVSVVLTAFSGNGASTGQPVIHFDQESVNVGNVSPGVALDYSFRFINEGNAPLIVGTEADVDVLEGC